jgi:hypothetical protein
MPASNLKTIFAALRQLSDGPGGVGNVPVRPASDMLNTAMTGRSAPTSPSSDTDRPTLASLRRLERENDMLVIHAEMLARALGACPNCWGTIDDCEDCGGAGHPGAYQPDRTYFDIFVLPVIARVMSPLDDMDVTQFRSSPDRHRDHPPS